MKRLLARICRHNQNCLDRKCVKQEEETGKNEHGDNFDTGRTYTQAENNLLQMFRVPSHGVSQCVSIFFGYLC